MRSPSPPATPPGHGHRQGTAGSHTGPAGKRKRSRRERELGREGKMIEEVMVRESKGEER